jgi:PRTRC genetic system ThiF family protein
MKETKTKVHIVEKYLLNPTNPIIVNVIGAGGTGSQIITALARMNQSLLALHHCGLFVRLFDNDVVSEANLGRQLFTQAELGMIKAISLINRINRFFGTNWKAIPYNYNKENLYKFESYANANIYISCVDTADARFEIAEMLSGVDKENRNRDCSFYWMDFGNSKDSGQVILSTVSNIKQPQSKKFETVARLPFITDEFESLLRDSDNDNTPSCSLVEALTKQDLFINSSLANLGASLLWQMFREGIIKYRGFFLNLKDFRTQPLLV